MDASTFSHVQFCNYFIKFTSTYNIIKSRINRLVIINSTMQWTSKRLAHRLAQITLQRQVTKRYLSALRCENSFLEIARGGETREHGLCTQIVLNGFGCVGRKNNHKSPYQVPEPHIKRYSFRLLNDNHEYTGLLEYSDDYCVSVITLNNNVIGCHLISVHLFRRYGITANFLRFKIFNCKGQQL